MTGPPFLTTSTSVNQSRRNWNAYWEVMTGIMTGVSGHTIQNILRQIQNNKRSVTVLVLFTLCHFNDFEHPG